MAVRQSTGMVNSLAAAMMSDFALGFIELYGVSNQPDDGDDTETGTLLGLITKDGDGSTGLTFATGDDAGEIKKSSETWTANFSAAGTVLWARVYDANHTKGASTTAKRFDVAAGVAGSGASLIMSTTTAEISGTALVQSFIYRIPKAAA